jgi:hypothetical protein
VLSEAVSVGGNLWHLHATTVVTVAKVAEKVVVQGQCHASEPLIRALSAQMEMKKSL